MRACQHCGIVAGTGASRLCSRVPGQVGLVGSHSYIDVPEAAGGRRSAQTVEPATYLPETLNATHAPGERRRGASS